MKNRMTKILIGLSLLVSLGSLIATKSSQAEALQKSPRVAELEDKLTRDASAYLKGRFPDQPFTVLVNIDPLRRNEGQVHSNNGQNNDNLPYLDVQNDDVQDEWDNPQVGLSELMVRVKKASVSVSVPSAVTDDETSEIKTALFSLLHLTPARDEVLLERKKWNSNSFPWLYVEIVSTMLFVLLIGLLFVHRNSASKLAHALSQLKGGGGQSQSEQAPQAVSAQSSSRSSDSPKSRGGDLKFSDPIRLKEVATRVIDSLIAQKHFPNLRQMIALDQLGRRNAPALGALLTEFPIEARKRVFSLSSDPAWLEALYSPGTMTMEALDALQTLQQQSKEVKSPAWEQLLILVWRLGDKTDGFFKGINQPKAFAILNELPKSVSIHVGRRSFPGNWGSLLDPAFKTISLDEAEIKELTTTALNLQPLSDIESLNRYREQIELLEYIKLADPREEREIYGACPPDSMIHKIRKPFYPVFEQSEDHLKRLIKSVPFDQWAIAFFNISRSERKVIEAQFSEKQCYLLSQRLKQLDANPPDRDGIEAARNQIAELCAALKVQPQDEEEAISLKSEFEKASKIAA